MNLKEVRKVLLERFGEPIGDTIEDNEGVPVSDDQVDMGNRGFGSKSIAERRARRLRKSRQTER